MFWSFVSTAMRYFIAIDPGLNGAICIIDTQEKTLKVTRTPTFTVEMKSAKTKSGKPKTRAEFDIPAMVALINVPAEEVIALGIEEVTARTGEGVTSSFRFGYGLGVWHGIIVAKGMHPNRYRPQSWKNHFDLIGEEKSASIAKATELLPACQPYWKLKKDDGLAEAALIALYTASQAGIQLEALTPVDTYEGKGTTKRRSKKADKNVVA